MNFVPLKMLTWRVRPVIYRIEKHDLRLFVGPQMDVFIDGSEASPAAERNLAFSSAPNGKQQSFSF